TPQLQQSIRLLQLSTVELNQEIDRLLMENPALEREDAEGGEHEALPQAQLQGGTSSSSAPAEPAPAETDWSADIASSGRGAPDDEEDGDRSFATPDTPTLRDHLLSQLSLTKLDERDRAFVMVLIDALDEDGYLTQPLEEIAALLPPEADAGMEELGIALRHLQHFGPAGVGARSPGECLCLQLRTLQDDAVRGLALHHLAEFLIEDKDPRQASGHRRRRARSAAGGAARCRAPPSRRRLRAAAARRSPRAAGSDSHPRPARRSAPSRRRGRARQVSSG